MSNLRKENNESRRVALTTKTLCETQTHQCPYLMKFHDGNDDCNLYEPYEAVKLGYNDKGISERCDQCRIDFPGVIEMRGRG